MAGEMTIEEVKKHVRVYLYVFGALLALTLVTVAVSRFDVSIGPALVIALVIALVKGALVAMYFMHLISEKQVIMWVLLSAAAFLLCMFALFISALVDQEQVALLMHVA